MNRTCLSIKNEHFGDCKKARPLTTKIKYLLILKGLTVEELARRIARRYRKKISATVVSKVIHGHRFTRYIQVGIAKELGVPFEDIFEVDHADRERVGQNS